MFVIIVIIVTTTPIDDSEKDPRAKLIRHYTKDIPDVSLHEIRMTFKRLKKNKAPGDNGITAEHLKAG